MCMRIRFPGKNDLAVNLSQHMHHQGSGGSRANLVFQSRACDDDINSIQLYMPSF